MSKGHFQMLAAYNRWANRLVYDAAAALSAADYRADRGVFFGSMHGTLNHILVADRMWMRRMTGEGAAPDRLDAILYEDLAGLRAARQREDARIADYVDSLDDARIAAPLAYRNVAGRTFEQPLAEVLTHFFNHQTHHRGQAHAVLTGFGQKGPEMDLIYFLRTR